MSKQTKTVEREKPKLDLTGQDGNIFFIVGRGRRELKRAGYSADDITRFCNEVDKAESYDAALRVVMDWFDVQ